MIDSLEDTHRVGDDPIGAGSAEIVGRKTLQNFVGQTVGWVAGKLLEKAGAGIGEPPTSAAILEGLWGLKDETLGGLTNPLTFVREKPAPPTVCWYNLLVRHGSWTTPDNYRCNWWGREDVASGTHEDRNAVSIPVTTMRVKRSRFLKANKTASGLVIEDVTCQRPR